MTTLHQRQHGSVLAAAERRLPVAIAARLPARVTSDRLTAVALISMVSGGRDGAACGNGQLGIGSTELRILLGAAAVWVATHPSTNLLNAGGAMAAGGLAFAAFAIVDAIGFAVQTIALELLTLAAGWRADARDGIGGRARRAAHIR